MIKPVYKVNSPASAEYYTPYKLAELFINFWEETNKIEDKNIKIICPCDYEEVSNIAKVLTDKGYKNVVCRHYPDYNFLEDTTDYINNFDWIITNPPFFLKHYFLQKANDYNLKIALIMPALCFFMTKRIIKLCCNNNCRILSMGHGGYFWNEEGKLQQPFGGLAFLNFDGTQKVSRSTFKVECCYKNILKKEILKDGRDIFIKDIIKISDYKLKFNI